MSLPRLAVLVGLAFALPSPAVAQLTLGDAIARADRRAYANRIATADADVRAGQALAPYRGILPALRVEAGFLRTTDPIGAFGTTLRQRAITIADFDPTRLNDPEAVGNRSAGLVVEQPILNADAWMARQAAATAARAARAAADWTRNSTRADVVRAYFGATLAAERAATLEAAERAALAHVARARALADTGLVTRSDALLAEVRAGDITAQRLAAFAEASHAGRALAVLLGEPGANLTLPPSLPAAQAIRAVVTADSAGQGGVERADVRAATLALNAARADVRRARAAYLPRVNGFARYDWNDSAAFFANKRSWTVGVMASWSPFAGASELSDLRMTTGRASAAAAQREAAVSQADLAREHSRSELHVALAQLDLAESAVVQATDAHRIVARKYDGGLATISDLLEAMAVETQSRLGLSMARYRTLVIAAERRQALGGDPSFLAALDQPVGAPSQERTDR